MEIIKIVQNGIELDVMGSVDASSITQDADNRFVTDAEKTTWNNKQDKLTAGTNVTITGTTISATDTVYDDTALKTRIIAVENREDKDTTYDVATTTTNGLMSSADKTKLDELNYTRAMTQAQYEELSQPEKERTDVWYGIYEE